MSSPKDSENTDRQQRLSEYEIVNKAIKSLPDSGGEILVDSSFGVTEQIEIDRNIVFRGIGRGHHSLAPGGSQSKLYAKPELQVSMFTYTDTVRYATLQNLVLYGNDQDVKAIISGTGSSRYLTLMACFFDSFQDNVINLATGYGFQCFGSTIEGSSTDHLILDGFDRSAISHSYFTGFGEGADLLKLKNCSNTIVQGCRLTGAGRSGLTINGSDRVISSNNIFYKGGQNISTSGMIEVGSESSVFCSDGDLVEPTDQIEYGVHLDDLTTAKIDSVVSSGSIGCIEVTPDSSNVQTCNSLLY